MDAFDTKSSFPSFKSANVETQQKQGSESATVLYLAIIRMRLKRAPKVMTLFGAISYGFRYVKKRDEKEILSRKSSKYGRF